MAKQLLIKLERSPIGCIPGHRKTVRGLGLTKVGATRWIQDTPPNRGMVRQVSYLVSILEEGREKRI